MLEIQALNIYCLLYFVQKCIFVTGVVGQCLHRNGFTTYKTDIFLHIASSVFHYPYHNPVFHFHGMYIQLLNDGTVSVRYLKE